MLFILLYECAGLFSGFIAVERASVRLNMKHSDMDYNKNSLFQIWHGTKLGQLYHVRMEVNSADLGTRPDEL